jgi:hypothetical protein
MHMLEAEFDNGSRGGEKLELVASSNSSPMPEK